MKENGLIIHDFDVGIWKNLTFPDGYDVVTASQTEKYAGRKKILEKNLKRKNSSCNAYLISEGIEDYSYIKDGRKSTAHSIG